MLHAEFRHIHRFFNNVQALLCNFSITGSTRQALETMIWPAERQRSS
jgi:hypothetical protein